MLRETPHKVDLLILGAGWTSTFLIPQLQASNITYAATTTTGRDNTIPFKFDPDSPNATPYMRLPVARTILITFPLRGRGQAGRLVGLYRTLHGQENNFIQLGATTIFNQIPDGWSDDDAPYDKSDQRGVAEDELMYLNGCVLDLAGLYGGQRVPRKWLPRLATTKEAVRERGAVHFVHGEDVARAIIATHKKFTPGKRWIITDLRVYDWYDLILSFSALLGDGEEGDLPEETKELKEKLVRWVGEIMEEEGIRALPRDMGRLGRKLDSRGFWNCHGIWPRHQRLA